MKKKIPVATALVLILFSVLLTFQITYDFVEKEYQEKVDTLTKTQSDFSKLADADALIRENFKGSIDEDSLADGLIKGYVSSLSDPYSRYLTASEYRVYQEEQTGSGSGIGARFSYDREKGEVLVYTLFPSSPAAASGLRKGDVLLKIGEMSVEDLSFVETVQALAGDAGTEVSVTVRRKVATQSLEMTFTMVRQEVQYATVSYERLSDSVGYVQIFNVTESTAREFSDAVDALVLSGVKGIVFDVRNSTGDHIDSVAAMLDKLLPSGVLMNITDQKGNEKKVKSDENAIDLSMSVLINSATAGVPELFAATMRDFGAATLVGETTYGKAALQTVVEMNDGSALVLTYAGFTPPSSPDFSGVGVIPDAESKLAFSDLYLATHEEDNQLQTAIANLGI